jgi:3-deoxy-manno-octulosonate cytidylyltransferase (CMP-KDO synthetase)
MSEKKIVGIIPARFASTRFPGKPLAMIGNMSMIMRVYHQALKSKKLNKVLVATDDERIKNHVESFNGKAVMTSAHHQSGTDRCAEVISSSNEKWNIVINIQGDEPFIDPAQIDLLISCFDDGQAQIATLIKKIIDQNDLQNSNVVKAVTGINHHALYFSRAKIPFASNSKSETENYYKHVGIYGYRTDVLKEISQLKQSFLEIMESLEQLRWLENGYSIKTAITEQDTISVDTPADLEKLKLTFNTENNF